MSGQMTLREKFFGCMVGCFVGSSMGAAVERWPYEKIVEKYGVLDKLVPYEHYKNGWLREPGTTEDGVERIKLMATTIIEKGDRINGEDLKKIWARDINPKAPGMVSEPFEAVLLAMSKTPMPAAEFGKYCDYSGLCSYARACQTIPLINAGDISNTINDIDEIGQLYLTSGSRGIKWAEVVGIGISAAMKPGATVDSVISTILENCDRGQNNPIAHTMKDSEKIFKGIGVLAELERGLELTERCSDFRELRETFALIYCGEGMAYPFSFANEVVTKAVCVFRMVKGNLKDSIIASVNMGRDTDCLAAVAAGISGALTGAGSVPKEWIEQVDRATEKNPYTNSKMTIRETADGILTAFKARMLKMKSYIEEISFGME